MRREIDAAEDGGTDPVDPQSQAEVEAATPRRRTADAFRTGCLPGASLRGGAEDQAAGVLHQLCLGRAGARTLGRESGWRRTCRRRGSTWCWIGGKTRRLAQACRDSSSGSRRATGLSWSARRSTARSTRKRRSDAGFVVAAEGDLIGKRMIGTEVAEGKCASSAPKTELFTRRLVQVLDLAGKSLLWSAGV